jgi:hypothetical protein
MLTPVPLKETHAMYGMGDLVKIILIHVQSHKFLLIFLVAKAIFS